MGDNVEFRGGSPAAVINVLRLPLYLRDSIFLGHIDPQSPLNGVNGGGVFAVVTYFVVLLVGTVVLLRRYREAER